MRAEFCIFESNAPGLKANFYEPYVDKPGLVPVGPYALALVAAAGALRSRRTAPAKVTGKEGLASGEFLASRDAQARVVAEAELSAKTCALSANRGLSNLGSESRPLIFGSARRRRGRGGAWRDAKCCGAGDISAA